MIPDYQSIMRPLLDVLSDGAERDTVALREELAARFHVSPEERAQLIRSGAPLFNNRVAWAYVHLQQAGAIERVARGRYRITDRGRSLLAENPARVDVKVLSQFPELVAFRKGSGGRQGKSQVPAASVQPDEGGSPTERMAKAHADHQAGLASLLMNRIQECDPSFFEQLVLKVLVAMGYGGSEQEASEHLGRSGDGGVDGVINEDQLGLDQVYVQAKRLTDNSVGRPDVQAFVGALEGRNANKGVFITSSRFSPEAKLYAQQVSRRVVLIDGERLAELMIRFGVGVTTQDTFAVQEIDGDFFIDELG